MDFLFHFSVPLISSLIAVAIIIFFFCYGKKINFQPDFANAIPVIDILKSLSKVCPINSLNKWILLPVDHGLHRCWMQTFSLPVMNTTINLYGSSAVVNSSAVAIGSLVADISKWADWNPFYSSQFIVKSFHDKQLKRDHYMEAEQIVSIVREDNKIDSQTFMYRFHDISDNKVAWILFWHAKRLEFSYFLIQPVKNKNEIPQCVLTHIIGTDTNTPSSASLILQRMRNVQDLLALSSVTLAPLKFTSSIQSGTGDSSDLNKVQPSSNSQETLFSLPAARARKRDVRNSMFILVPFQSSNHWLWTKKKGFKLGVKNMEVVSESKFQEHMAKQKVLPKNESTLKYPVRRAKSDVGLKNKSLIDACKQSKTENNLKEISDFMDEKLGFELKQKSVNKLNQNSDTTSEDSEAMNGSKTQNQFKIKNKMLTKTKLQSCSEKTVGNSDLSSIREAQNKHNCDNISKLQNIDESAEDNVLALDDQDPKEFFNSSISDFEVVENCEFTENRIAGFMTQGNYGASELQAEVLLASQFDQNLNASNFYLNAGNWIFHSHHRGLTVLSKTTSSQFLHITSFLCQTELPVCPKDIWKFVKNPQFRFICDETVKSVEVLEKISSSQKLIHTYHEVGGLLRKELVDFCLLQTEREELNKYYSCFYSVEFDKCPFMKSVIRGTLRPSGWIVEESVKGSGKSRVTYMIQILINSPDSLLIQELSTLVPQSVHNLKNYITSKPV